MSAFQQSLSLYVIMKTLLLNVLLLILQRQSLVIYCQQSSPESLPFIKTLPKFSYETLTNATSLNVNENTPLNTGAGQYLQDTFKLKIFSKAIECDLIFSYFECASHNISTGSTDSLFN